MARFIVAPDGYGKTSLALEYAETMFAWSHTFWFGAKSPCFIRDLDAGVLASGCLEVDSEAKLVVIDGLPLLDAERAAAFSQEVDALLGRGCEVVVTCVPSSDLPGSFQRDRIRLGARDLLLTDDELDEARTSEERMRKPADQVAESYRVPMLAWGHGEEAHDSFARLALGEELPADLLLVIASTMVLQRGTFEDLRKVASFDRQAISEVIADYPHLGFGEDVELFDAAPVKIDPIAAAVKGRLEDMAARSRFERGDELVTAWADILLDNKLAGRACDAMRAICPRKSRGAWIAANAPELARQSCFYPSLRLAKDHKGIRGDVKARLVAFEALCRRVLGDGQGALRCAKRCAFDASAQTSVRVCSALIVDRLGPASLGEQARAVLGQLALPDGRSAGDGDARWEALALAWLTGLQGLQPSLLLWERFRDEGAPDDVLCVFASWLFAALAREESPSKESLAASGVLIGPVERYVRERLSASCEQGPDYLAASAGLSLEEAHTRGVPYSEGPLEAGTLFALRQVEVGVLAQRSMFEQDERAARAKRSDWEATRPDSYLAPSKGAASRERSVPVLSLKLFGGFEVSIGDIPVDQKKFRRQNARVLLVLLAVNQGKEVPRDQLVRAMWPTAAVEVGRKNFYTVWAQLRQSLSLPDGTCPYLVRHQYGCSLERRYVQSDVVRLSEICRELLFGAPDVTRWSAFFTEIDRDFSADLMPSERRNQMVIQARGEYRSRLIDALVAATFSIVEEGHPQWGIWFARTAIAHDETREDAYVALMRAQVAGNQRTAAMMTFLKCRRVLNDRLGIDPSPEAEALYRSLLDSE